MSAKRNTERIRSLNDAFRTADSSPLGTWILTAGVSAEGPEFMLRAVDQVKAFDRFSPDNDPHKEHDFGSFEIDGQRLFWKIDYYDPTLTGGADDPSDPDKTCRVLTIMFASEY